MTKEQQLYTTVAIIGFITGMLLSNLLHNPAMANNPKYDMQPEQPLIINISELPPGDIPVLKDKPLEAERLVAKVTAYTCDSSMTPAQKAMNCPNGITATGTVPKHKKTVACPRHHLGKKFDIYGVGVVTCEDVGGAIKGAYRFDLFVDTYDEAIVFGSQYLSFQEVK